MSFIQNKVIFLIIFFSLSSFAQIEIKNIFNKENGLPCNQVEQVIQDNFGYLWIATQKGLFRFDGNDFKKSDNRKINVLLHNNNKIYVGLDDGLLIKSNTNNVFIKSNKVINIIKIDNNIYVTTNKGLFLVKNSDLEPIRINIKIDNSIVYDIAYSNDLFYIATNKGLWSLKELTFSNSTKPIDNDNIIDLEVYNKILLAASKSKNEVKLFKKDTLETFKTKNVVSSIHKIKNQLWFSSKLNGIEIYSLPSLFFQNKINKYNTSISDNINNVFEDKQNIIWVSTNSGLYQLKKEGFYENKQIKPQINFESFEVNYKDKSQLLNNNKIELPNSSNSLIIRYKTIDLLNSKNIFYRYVINGKSSKWSKDKSLQLANLKYGTYKIEIQSMLDDVKSDIKSISFTIATPFYLNAYFILLIILSIIVIAYLLVEINIKKIKKKNQIKINQLKIENTLLNLKQKALQLQMNPHFIFNVLNGIKALGNSGNTKELNVVISQFSNLLRSILHNSKKEEISLKEEIESLHNYLNLEKRISSKEFDFFIDADLISSDLEEILVPTMLFQPFIENSIKHGFKGTKKGIIEVKIEEIKGFLYISITDNGVGLNASKHKNNSNLHNSLALQITKERLNNISKRNNFSISEYYHNNKVSGTKVKFRIPVKTDF